MSAAELKDFIDSRTAEEREWMTAYLFDRLFDVPELKQTAEELRELALRRAEMMAGTNRISQAEAESHWEALERVAEE